MVWGCAALGALPFVAEWETLRVDNSTVLHSTAMGIGSVPEVAGVAVTNVVCEAAQTDGAG